MAGRGRFSSPLPVSQCWPQAYNILLQVLFRIEISWEVRVMELVSNLLTGLTAKSPPVVQRPSSGQESVENSAPPVDGAKADSPAPVLATRQVQANTELEQADSSAQRQRQDQQDPGKVQEAVKNANDFFQIAKRTLQFAIHEDDGRVVVQIKDEKTGQVVRQIPSEEALELAKRLDELSGLLFKEKV